MHFPFHIWEVCMELHLYKIEDRNNTINKILGEYETIQATFTQDFDVLEPTFIVNYNIMAKEWNDYNYIYCVETKRYYFIDSYRIIPSGIVYYKCSVDVLQTYKDIILNSSGLVSRNKNIGVESNNDSDETYERTVSKIDIPINFGNEKIILVASAGKEI